MVPEGKQRAVVANVMRVVIVVHLGSGAERKIAIRDKPEVVTGMAIHCFDKPHRQPNPERVDMTFEQHGAYKGRNTVGNRELEGMEVLCCKAKGLVQCVVELVEAGVEKRLMEESVQPVEGSVFNEHEEHNL